MAGKAKKALADGAGADDKKAPSDGAPLTSPTKVNTSNLTELKVALDDCAKQFFEGHFVRSYRHEDVRLVLGWSAALIGFASAAYGYSTDFHDSKRIVAAGVILYVMLHSVLAWYGKYVEQDAIFVGKRRNFGSRVTTEKLTVSSVAHALPSYHFPLSLIHSPASTSAKTAKPSYELKATYVHSANNGKALLHGAEWTIENCVGDWFDSNGNMDKPAFERELQKVLDQVTNTTASASSLSS